MANDWLSLSEVAALIGVHPSTVRSWANDGRLPTHRTQGGHRRFRRTDIDLWMHSQGRHEMPVDLIVQHVLRRTRLEVTDGKLEGEGWYAHLSSEARDQYRLSGRSLLLGLVAHLSDTTTPEQSAAEARSLGFEYAARGQGCGLSVTEAVSAFLFFRGILVNSMINYYEEAGIASPKAWSELVHKSQDFTDRILVALLQTYEGNQRGVK